MMNIRKIIILIILIVFSIQTWFAEESYKLTMKDKLLINNISTKINTLIDKKWNIITSKYVTTINKTIKKTEKNWRIYLILAWIKTNIVNHTNNKYIKENNLEQVKNETLTKWEYVSKTNFSEFKIDITKVRTSWLWYFNNVRKSMWRNPYSYDTMLNDTAEEWSDTSLTRWYISHKRDPNDSYYNYNKITSRFKDRWVVCKNINRITHSENIGRWYYSCSDGSDCTDKLIWGIKQVFDMYMAEKWKSSHAHYDSIVMTQFSKIWVWIAIKKSSGSNYEFYITTHYCTEIID